MINTCTSKCFEESQRMKSSFIISLCLWGCICNIWRQWPTSQGPSWMSEQTKWPSFPVNAWLPTVHRGSSDPNVLYLPFCHPHWELSPTALPVHLQRAGLFIALPGVAVIYRAAGLSPDKAQKMSHGVVQSSQMSFRLICKSHYQQFYWGSSDHFILLS